VEAHRVVRCRGSHILPRQSAHRWRWGCQCYTPAAIYLPPAGRFLVFISVRGSVNPRAHSEAGKIMSNEKFNDVIGNRTRDLPACSIVPQRTKWQRVPDYNFKISNFTHERLRNFEKQRKLWEVYYLIIIYFRDKFFNYINRTPVHIIALSYPSPV
jgi:hypothetical protein